MKLLRTICIAALALGLATSVYAGTQSVKISGDLAIRGFARGDYDLCANHQEPVTPATQTAAEALQDSQVGSSDWETFYMTQVELQVDADLTDNVSAVIRLFNQRDWNVRSKNVDYATDSRDLTTIYTADGDEFDIGVDLAYIELKEFLYSPLTLRIGRQDLWFGKGFIVGANLQDYNDNIGAAHEYTVMRSFDAARATLDYDPWTIDAVAAMIKENVVGSKDDVTLWGVNVGYVFDMFNGEAEAYWFNKTDRGTVPDSGLKQHNTVHNIGIRGSADPLESLTLAAEGAYQFGHFVGMRGQKELRQRSAWAFDGSAETRYFKEIFPWKPIIGAEYILYSGDTAERAVTENTTGNYNGWDYMYRGKFDTAYREWVGTYNVTHMGRVTQNVNYIDRYPDLSRNNQHQVLVYGNLTPMDSLTLDGKLAFFWQQYTRFFTESQINPGNYEGVKLKRSPYLGAEFDFGATWDYTEDVSFGVLAAWFFPGTFYYDQSDSVATDIVGTVKLSF